MTLKINSKLTLVFPYSNLLGVALDDTGLLVDKIVCWYNKHDLFPFASLIFIIVDAALLIHPLFLQLLRRKLS